MASPHAHQILDGLPARERLLAAASRLFCRYGINAVGVDTVVAEAGTAKATLYKTFGSKENLVDAVLEKEGEAWRDWFIAALNSGEAKPVDRLKRIFPVLKDWFCQDRFYGCPFINAVSEHDKRDDHMRSLALRHKQAVLGEIARLAGEAGSATPEKLAHQLGILIDGAIVAAMITKDAAMADTAATAAEGLLAPLH
jgi:AcrR family transcriptional regulator